MEKDYFQPNDTDFSTECELISSNNPNPCLASGDDDKTLYLFDIKNLSDKRKELQRFVSSIVTSLNTKVSNKNMSSKLLITEKRKSTYDVSIKSDIKNKLSFTREWDCNKLIYSRSIATFSLYTSNDGMTKSLKSYETDTGLALKACDPMDSNISIKYLRDKDEEFHQKMKFFLESDKYFPLNKKCIEICDLSNINCIDITEKNTLNNHNAFLIKVKRAYSFFKSHKMLCQLSLYLYVYGIVGLVLILFNINPYKYCLLDTRLLYNL
ncbi:uncharacterized protein LOC118446056 isoform X1 [Vespa mandarinia]|uniref:uncharacterized protein LOC118446056 isoform X1 n=1 Tax=Vespa mandarinia TaxID=7446 RepID=UPI00161DFC35|nr:uncharacterized protein LOC118446056 isoform X1 [Vespa mandarinia]